jgi:hypothetical protein
MMNEEKFTQLIREFIHREPFVPFQVDLTDGQRIVIDSPSVAFAGTAAGFVSEKDGLVAFSCEEVTSITRSVAEAHHDCRVLEPGRD